MVGERVGAEAGVEATTPSQHVAPGTGPLLVRLLCYGWFQTPRMVGLVQEGGAVAATPTGPHLIQETRLKLLYMKMY